jgi:hypothetical protein
MKQRALYALRSVFRNFPHVDERNFPIGERS